MRRVDYPSKISESVNDLLELEKAQAQSKFQNRVRLLRYLKAGTCKTLVQVSELLGLSHRQIQNYWKLYQDSGLEGLLENRYEKRWYFKLNTHQISQLRHRISQGDLMNQIQIKDWIEAEFGIVYTQSGISKLLEALKIKLKTGRPVNVRKDEAGEVLFKKTSMNS